MFTNDAVCTGFYHPVCDTNYTATCLGTNLTDDDCVRPPSFPHPSPYPAPPPVPPSSPPPVCCVGLDVTVTFGENISGRYEFHSKGGQSTTRDVHRSAASKYIYYSVYEVDYDYDEGVVYTWWRIADALDSVNSIYYNTDTAPCVEDANVSNWVRFDENTSSYVYGGVSLRCTSPPSSPPRPSPLPPVMSPLATAMSVPPSPPVTSPPANAMSDPPPAIVASPSPPRSPPSGNGGNDILDPILTSLAAAATGAVSVYVTYRIRQLIRADSVDAPPSFTPPVSSKETS